MSDFIYNNFSNDPDNDPNDNKPIITFEQVRPKKSNKPLAAIILSIMLVVMILFSAFSILFINKLEDIFNSNSGNNYNNSTIYSHPTVEKLSNSNSQITPSEDGYYTISQVAYMVKDSVVEVTCYSQNKKISAGSGVIIGTYDGGYFIVTNAHVIQDSRGNVITDVKITTTNEKVYKISEVKGCNSYKDIAVLAVKTNDTLQCVPIIGASEPVLGEEVIAIGNPLGSLGGTITNGIISALDREISIDGSTLNLLQTNAAINSGNSGGGLFNLKGELIGIVNAKSFGTGIEGLGFAIPIKDAAVTINNIIGKGSPFLEITFSTVTVSNDNSYIYIHDLTAGYNDDVLKIQDIVKSLNGEEVKSMDDLSRILSTVNPGDKITIVVERNHVEMAIELKVFQRKY